MPRGSPTSFDSVTALGVDGITVSPGYAYERAPDQKHFLNRSATKQLFRDIFRRGDGGRKWAFNQSGHVPRLPGRQSDLPLHALGQSNAHRLRLAAPLLSAWRRLYAATFKELMEETDWDAYGTGNYAKCANCMVHSGFEATAVSDTVARPWKALGVTLRGA